MLKELGAIKYGDETRLEKLVFYLNHSCDEWVIGDINAAKQFAKDLLALIDIVEKEDRNA